MKRLLLLAASLVAAPVWAQVEGHQKISALEGGFTGLLDDGDGFGAAVARLGDLGDDGTAELAVGAPYDDDGCPVATPDCDRGAVWILSLNTDDGTVFSHQKISSTEGGFTGPLDDADQFGSAVAGTGDLDGDGTFDLVVGAPLDDDGGADQGAAWVLFLNPDGTVRDHQKISATEGGFTGDLDPSDEFGTAVASLADLDGDGVGDLAVGAPFDDSGSADQGAVWVLFLNPDGAVRDHDKLFILGASGADGFGTSVASPGDIDNDGVNDLAVGAPFADTGDGDQGVVRLFLLAPPAPPLDLRTIGEGVGSFSGDLEPGDHFGSALAGPGDLDDDRALDLFVGASGDDDGGGAGADRGAVWSLLLRPNGEASDEQAISATEGGFTGPLDDGDAFGSAIASMGERNDGSVYLAVGAPDDDDGGLGRGAVWVLFFTVTPTASEPGALPVAFALSEPSPNPSSDAARFTLETTEAQAAVRVEALDGLGRRVALLHDGPLAAGSHPFEFVGAGLPSGLYLVRASGEGFTATRRVVLTR